MRPRTLAAGLGALTLGAAAALPAAAPAADRVPGQLRRANLKPLLLRAPQVAPRVKNLIRNSSGRSGGSATPSLSYGDLTGDGRAEVAVPIFSGGTAGDIAYYVLGVVRGRVRVLGRSTTRTRCSPRSGAAGSWSGSRSTGPTIPTAAPAASEQPSSAGTAAAWWCRAGRCAGPRRPTGAFASRVADRVAGDLRHREDRLRPADRVVDELVADAHPRRERWRGKRQTSRSTPRSSKTCRPPTSG